MEGVDFFIIGSVFLVGLFLLPFIQCDETNTSLEVENSSPYLMRDIPFISFEGGSYVSDLNLNEYFLDPEGDSLSYGGNTTTDFVNVSVSSTGVVSFVASPGFNSSSEYVTFTASDGHYPVESNAVRMYIGDDILPPYYTNVSMDKDIVYQNDFVNFYSHWHDDRGMKSFDFYLQQEGLENSSWIKSTENLSGKDVLVSIKKQISVPLGSYVKWKFCGNDTSDNRNCTSENEFYVFEKPPKSDAPLIDGEDSEGESGNGSEGDSESQEAEESFLEEIFGEDIFESKDNFSLSADSFSIDLKQGTGTTKVFEIFNNGNNALDFELGVEALEEMVFLSERNFTLGAGKSKKIIIDFRAGISLEPGEYYGKLIIKSINDVEVPIAIFVNFADIKYDLNVSVQEEVVKPGRNVSAVIEIRSLRDIASHDISVEFAIKDFYGTIYFSGEESMKINKILNLEKEFVIPRDFMVGEYIFYTRVSSEKDYTIGSDDFRVGTSYRFDYYLKYSFMFLVIFLLSFVFLFLFWRYRAKKKREKALNLYIKFQEMKDYMQKGDYSNAANMYLSIKKIYGEKVSQDVLNDKDELAKKIEALAKKMDFSDAGKGSKEEKKEDSKEEKKEDSKEEKKEGEKAEDKNKEEGD